MSQANLKWFLIATSFFSQAQDFLKWTSRSSHFHCIEVPLMFYEYRNEKQSLDKYYKVLTMIVYWVSAGFTIVFVVKCLFLQQFSYSWYWQHVLNSCFRLWKIQPLMSKYVSLLILKLISPKLWNVSLVHKEYRMEQCKNLMILYDIQQKMQNIPNEIISPYILLTFSIGFKMNKTTQR